MKVAVIMPAFNEARTLDAILERVLAQPCVAEVVAVDDGSTDGSWEILQRWATARSAGVTPASAPGLRPGSALSGGGTPASALSAGRPPEPAAADGCAISIRRDPTWHTWGNRLLTWASNRVTGLRLTDEATCYKLLRTADLRAMGLRERGFGFCPEVTAKVARRD
jgi:hypothetical protein